MMFYEFKDYDALFDLISYTRIKASLFFGLIKNYTLKDIDGLYRVCKKKLPKKDKIITSNIDSHIARALDLLLYPKEELILPVARFYGKKFRDYLIKRGVVNNISFTKGLVRGEPTLNSIDILVSVDSLFKLRNAIESFYLFKRYIEENERILSFISSRGHRFNIYLSEDPYFGNASFYLSFPDEVMDYIKKRFSYYSFSYDQLSYGNTIKKFEEESQIFDFLNMEFIPYELRWDKDSIKKATEFMLPKLIDISDVKGDFHIHTFFSDGEGYIEHIYQEAIKLNYDYVAITEHSVSQRTGNGISPTDWKIEADLIEELNEKYPDFSLLKGLEVDILGDGGLDFPYEILKEMDIVILALHHPEYGTLDPNEKIAYAMKSGIGSILAHPKDRYWGRELKFSLELPYLFDNALRYKVALEISSIPDRIGFTSWEVKEGKKKGVKFAINSDAHAPGYLRNVDIGVIRARRGWLTSEEVINTYNYERLIREKIIRKGK